MLNPPVLEQAKSAPGFVDIDSLTSADGIRAVISQRRVSGELTVGVFRVFERDGQENRTSFIPESMRDAFLAQIGRAFARVDELKKDPTQLPFPLNESRPVGRRR